MHFACDHNFMCNKVHNSKGARGDVQLNVHLALLLHQCLQADGTGEDGERERRRGREVRGRGERREERR